MSRILLIGLVAAGLPALANAAAPAGDTTKGEALFKKTCSVCHTVVDDGAVHPGPLLKGVVGRKAASLPAFKAYSGPLKASGLTWDRANLDKFLTLPSNLVPGTFMVINLPAPSDRQNIIAYLASTGDTPAPAAKAAGKTK